MPKNIYKQGKPKKIIISKHAKSLLHYEFVVGEHGKWHIRGIVQLLYCGLRQQEISLNLIFSQKSFFFSLHWYQWMLGSRRRVQL